jgi:2-iminobutanoate/2-iminopropanoate deaminase
MDMRRESDVSCGSRRAMPQARPSAARRGDGDEAVEITDDERDRESLMQLIHPSDCPPVGGPYSPAVVDRGLVYVSGQVGLDPETGRLASDGVRAEADRAFANLAGVLNAAGSALEEIVRTAVYLTNVDDFAAMNEVFERCMAGHRPARTTVVVAALPLGATIEVDCIARLAAAPASRDGTTARLPGAS